MTKNEFIITVLQQIEDKTQRHFVEMEISNHIEDRMDFYLDAGYSNEIAEARALERMGDAKELGIKMNYLHDCRKLNVISIICIALIGISFLLNDVILASTFEYLDFLGEQLMSMSYTISNGVIFLAAAILFILCIRTKNYKFARWGALLSMLRYVVVFFFGSYAEAVDFSVLIYVAEIMEDGIDVMNFNSVLLALGVVFYMIGFINTVAFFGLSEHLRWIYHGNARTNVLSRYEAFAPIPLIEFIVIFVLQVATIVVVAKG